MAVRPYCSICRAHYRGIYPIHMSTKSHQLKVARKHTPGRLDRAGLRATLGYQRLDVKRLLAGDTGSDRTKVRSHRRSPPNDGARKVVRVQRYWRREPWRPTKW